MLYLSSASLIPCEKCAPRKELQKDTKNSHFEIFDSVLYIKSGIMPLSCNSIDKGPKTVKCLAN